MGWTDFGIIDECEWPGMMKPEQEWNSKRSLMRSSRLIVTIDVIVLLITPSPYTYNEES